NYVGPVKAGKSFCNTAGFNDSGGDNLNGPG
ncbi:unnamed protein product, partial [marine sediment metagenome]